MQTDNRSDFGQCGLDLIWTTDCGTNKLSTIRIKTNVQTSDRKAARWTLLGCVQAKFQKNKMWLQESEKQWRVLELWKWLKFARFSSEFFWIADVRNMKNTHKKTLTCSSAGQTSKVHSFEACGAQLQDFARSDDFNRSFNANKIRNMSRDARGELVLNDPVHN